MFYKVQYEHIKRDAVFDSKAIDSAVFRPPGSFRRSYVLLLMFFFLSEISELRWPIAAKLCRVIES